MNNWNKSYAKWMILYAVLYAAGTAIVCVTGAIHPVLFVCYQITAGILLSGIIIRAFARVKAPGAAVCLALGMLILLVVIKDAAAWHVIPVIVIAIAAEIVRAVSKYSWKGDVISTAIMSFSSFGYYGDACRIWRHPDGSQSCLGSACSCNHRDHSIGDHFQSDSKDVWTGKVRRNVWDS